MSRISSFSLLVLLAVMGAGCGDEQPPAQSAAPVTERERQINNTQAASAVGYDGDAVKRSVQGMVDTSDKQQQTLDAATNAAQGSEADPDAAK